MTEVRHRGPGNPLFAARVRADRRGSTGARPSAWIGIERRQRVGDRRGFILLVACPSCGHVDRLSAASYEGWPEGILCGICGPPHVRMVLIGADAQS
jgi:hypothetical protein